MPVTEDGWTGCAQSIALQGTEHRGDGRVHRPSSSATTGPRHLSQHTCSTDLRAPSAPVLRNVAAAPSRALTSWTGNNKPSASSFRIRRPRARSDFAAKPCFRRRVASASSIGRSGCSPPTSSPSNFSPSSRLTCRIRAPVGLDENAPPPHLSPIDRRPHASRQRRKPHRRRQCNHVGFASST